MLLAVHEQGVLLTGDSGTGKSALALELVCRGHALVADDAVEIQRPAPGTLVGSCPPLLQGCLAVRGLGILDVRALWGPLAVRDRQSLNLIVHLASAGRAYGAASLINRHRTRRLLGESLPVYSFVPRLSHNLAALVEAACLNQRLRQRGVAADRTFIRRQQNAIKRQT